MTRRWVGPAASLALLGATVAALPWSRAVFARAFPDVPRPLYGADSFAALTAAHAALVLVAAGVAGLGGVALAVAVTRPAGRSFRPLAESLVAMGQTVPPVAVLALAVPAIGFGPTPALIALSAYGLLPVVQGALAGLDGIPGAVRDAAEGIGMGPWRRLLQVELPLARPLILAGLRTSTVINVGTATIASAVGVRTLGTPIILGLDGDNAAYVIQGALPTALLAIALDQLIGWAEAR